MAVGRVAPNQECVLWRTWYRTDMSTSERDFNGVITVPFPPPTPDQLLVGVDWSETGWVEVTWLITRDMPNPADQV